MKSFTTNIPLYYNSSNMPLQNSLPVVKNDNNSRLSTYTNEKDPFMEFNSKCTKSGSISHPNSIPDSNTSSLNMKLKQKLMSISSNSQASNLASPKLIKLDNPGEVANPNLKYGNILHSTLKDKVDKNNRIHVKNEGIKTNRNTNNEVSLNPSNIKNNINSKIKTYSHLENIEKAVKTINLINDNNTTKINNYNENDKKFVNHEKSENQIKFVLKSNDNNQSNDNGDSLSRNSQINKINMINLEDNSNSNNSNVNFVKNNQSNSTIKILNIQETNQLNDTPKNYLANKRAINKKVNKNEEMQNQEKFDYNFKPNQIKMDSTSLIQSNNHTNIPTSQDVSLNEKNCNKINIENNSNTSNTSSIVDEQSSASKSNNFKKNLNSKSNTNNYSNNRNEKKPNQYSYNELSSNKLSNSNNTNNSNYNSSKPKNYNSILSIKIKNMSYKEVDSFYNLYIPILPHQIFEKKMEN